MAEMLINRGLPYYGLYRVFCTQIYDCFSHALRSTQS
nr:MAG TPA_asm: hypothetical protein [Caudoviricetes sp.]